MMSVNRHRSAEEFLATAQRRLMSAEAENNLVLGIVGGIARNPSAATDPYLATVSGANGVVGCAVHIAPYKLVITRADQETIVCLANDAHLAARDIDGVTGPARSASHFALAWSRLSGARAVPGMRLRIHEIRNVLDPGAPPPTGRFRVATPADHDRLSEWARVFVEEARIPERVDARRVVEDAVARGRLYVWDEGGPVSMAAWTGKTPNGVRINFAYTPPELRRRGYATACVGALTREQLQHGNLFCWLYTDLSNPSSAGIFTRIGYQAVSDVEEFVFDGRQSRSDPFSSATPPAV